jgi:hypothetical protein
MHRTRVLCDEDSLNAELDFLKTIFRQDDYSSQQRVALCRVDPALVAFLATVSKTFNIKFVGFSPWRISSFPQLVKDDLYLKTLDLYSVPCMASFILEQIFQRLGSRRTTYLRKTAWAIACNFRRSVFSPPNQMHNCIIKKRAVIGLYPNNM